MPEQIELLKRRGMLVHDEQQATVWLQRVGYYRLSGYWHAFREWTVDSSNARQQGRTLLDTFRPGTKLTDVFQLYAFDKRLRLVVMDALERIEVSLRVDIALILGREDPWAHRNPNTFNRFFRSTDQKDSAIRHTKWLNYLDNSATRSKEEFAKHFAETYKDPTPLWIAIELWDFGTLSAVINGMKNPDLQTLAERYQVSRRTILQNWVQCLNVVRNVCAHHGRLWNRPLVIQPALSNAGEAVMFDHVRLSSRAATRLYGAMAISQYLLRTISPGSTWGKRLEHCMSQIPAVQGIDLTQAGFPPNWTQEALWERNAEAEY